MNEIVKYEDNPIEAPINRAIDVSSAKSVDAMLEHVRLIRNMRTKVMKKGEHYGVIPGCGKKPTLLKAGAEILAVTFHLDPQYEVTRSDYEGGHREYEVKCTLYFIPTGKRVASGVGTCTTLESKYRYRGYQSTGELVPKEYWKNRDKSLLGASNHVAKKIDNKWMICEKLENPDIADTYNTVLKISKKRSYVDAILTATGASEIFTQDLEDIQENKEKSVDDMPPDWAEQQDEAGDANESKSTSGDKFEHAVIPNTMGREKPEVRGPQEKSGAAEGSTAKETAPDVQAIKSMYKSFITLSREPALKNGLRAMVDASSYDEKSDPAGVVAEAKERHWQQAGENLMRYFGWLC